MPRSVAPRRPAPGNDVIENWIFGNGYRYWCFLSYARGGFEERFVVRLKQRLAEHIGSRFTRERNKVFLDRHDIEKGAAWQRTLAASLCRSVLHVAVVGDTYFNSNKHWCRREFQMMVDLSRRRTSSAGERTSLFPIAFRSTDRIPKEISDLFDLYEFKASLTARYLYGNPVEKLADSKASRIEDAARDLYCQRFTAVCRGAALPAPYSASTPRKVVLP